ncbi:MAG: ABC transporter permease [Candidatus Heimdallarchaeota archaeon]|nr:ABC transporter permease [Candidatus Heimdallarchaeota archaeon]MCK5048100.1 ABC transporter permease [Candidatus Heimdallarchaeota archaeon]
MDNSLIIAKRVLKQLARDRRTIALVLVVPLIIMMIFGYAFGGEFANLPVELMNTDEGDFGSQITELIASDKRISPSFVSDYEKSKVNVDESKIKATILIPNNFTEAINNVSLRASIIVYSDPTEPAIRGSIIAAIAEGIDNFLKANNLSLGIEIIENLANNGEEFDAFTITLPSILAFVMNMLILLISSVFLVREKIQNTRTRMFMTPIRPRDMIIGYIITLNVLAIMISLSLITISTLFLGAELHGNPFIYVPLILLFGSSFIFLGIAISSIAQNEIQAIQMAIMVALPSMALSGFMVPIYALPQWLQIISYIVPLRYGISLFRGVMLKEYSFMEVLFPEVAFLVGFSAIMLFVAIKTTKET